MIQVSFILITIIANRRGLTDAAAVGIVEKIMSFLFLVPSSMLSTVSALGAQNIGAGKPERARQHAAIRHLHCRGLRAGGGRVAMSVHRGADGGPVYRPGTATAHGRPAGRADICRGYIWDCVFAGIHFSFSGYFCACGRSELSFLHNIVAIVLVRVPGAYLASRAVPGDPVPHGSGHGAWARWCRCWCAWGC